MHTIEAKGVKMIRIHLSRDNLTTSCEVGKSISWHLKSTLVLCGSWKRSQKVRMNIENVCLNRPATCAFSAFLTASDSKPVWASYNSQYKLTSNLCVIIIIVGTNYFWNFGNSQLSQHVSSGKVAGAIHCLQHFSQQPLHLSVQSKQLLVEQLWH